MRVENADGVGVSFEVEVTVMATIDSIAVQVHRSVEYIVVPKLSQVALDALVMQATKPPPQGKLMLNFTLPARCDLDDAVVFTVRADRSNAVAESVEYNNEYST